MISHNLNKVTPGVGMLIFQARQFLSDVVSSNYESVVSSHSRLRFVKSVQKHHHTQTSEGIDERCQQSHHRNQTSHNVQYVADESRHQQNRCQEHSNQRQKCCFVERHGRSISALRTFRNDRFAAYRTVRVVGLEGSRDPTAHVGNFLPSVPLYHFAKVIGRSSAWVSDLLLVGRRLRRHRTWHHGPG
jgi:hypothetical protein